MLHSHKMLINLGQPAPLPLHPQCPRMVLAPPAPGSQLFLAPLFSGPLKAIKQAEVATELAAGNAVQCVSSGCPSAFQRCALPAGSPQGGAGPGRATPYTRLPPAAEYRSRRSSVARM